MPTMTPGALDAAKAFSSAPSMAARFAGGNGSDVLTSAARTVAATASNASSRDNARARGARQKRSSGMDSSWITADGDRQASAILTEVPFHRKRTRRPQD